MASPTEETEPQPMLRRDSPSSNDGIPWPSSPGVAGVVSHLEIYPQPPTRVRAYGELYIVARLTCHPAQLRNISIIAVATLLNQYGEELPGKVCGRTIESLLYLQNASSTTTRYCFTLVFPDSGKYRVRINLERVRTGQDDDTWLHVESEDITVTSFDQDQDQDSEGTNIVSLHFREVDIEHTCDTELFPWKMSRSPLPEVVLGGIIYDRIIVFIPEAEILSIEGFSNHGEGILVNDGEWNEIDWNEARSGETEEDEIIDGDDGRKYYRGKGCLESYYVGLRREVVMIDGVRHIAHLVLVENSGYHWREDTPILDEVQADVALPILQPNKPTSLKRKRPSDGEIGGDLRDEE